MRIIWIELEIILNSWSTLYKIDSAKWWFAQWPDPRRHPKCITVIDWRCSTSYGRLMKIYVLLRTYATRRSALAASQFGRRIASADEIWSLHVRRNDVNIINDWFSNTRCAEFIAEPFGFVFDPWIIGILQHHHWHFINCSETNI